MTTWISELHEGAAGGLRVAVKDAIDVAGTLTTAGSPHVAAVAVPARADAGCLAGFRRAKARLVGKANLHELCFGTSGINPHFGTPVNPIAPALVPGGSSSGSAVAVGTEEADVALGTDTGGSVRIPAACCGVVGLKTTWGRVPTDGVWPLSPSLDTVGPLARDMATVMETMPLLCASWEPSAPGQVVGRVRRPGVDPSVEAAVDRVLAASELEVVDIELPGWDLADHVNTNILLGEFWQAHGRLLANNDLTTHIADGLRYGSGVTEAQLREAKAGQQVWRDELTRVFERVEILALPTLLSLPPALDHSDAYDLTALTWPFNVSGNPAASVPVPMVGTAVPTSLQLVGPFGRDELVCATAAKLESVARTL